MAAIITPALLFLLFHSLSAVPQGGRDNEPQIEGLVVDQEATNGDEIEKANVNIASHLVDGDIVPYRQRNADPCVRTGCKWRKTRNLVYIPVVIDSIYTEDERETIINALVSFYDVTCIRFVWRTRHRDYLHFFSGSGCWSYLGRVRGKQYVSLKQRGCMSKRIIQHEVLHALAFNHEQVRSDRDRYVTILTQNIRPDAIRNFKKKNTRNLGISYDYNSVMHYSKYAFSKNRQPTIVSKGNRSFGNAREMSSKDIARVNRLYRCRV